jgi:polyphosphate kinase
VDDPDLTRRIEQVLEIMLKDNVQAWELGEDGEWQRQQPAEGAEVVATHRVLQELALRQGAVTRRAVESE